MSNTVSEKNGQQLKNDVTFFAEGKTKIVWQCIDNPDLCIIESKNDITCVGKGMHDVIENKAFFANQTTCNVFKLLAECNIPVAFQKELSDSKFLAKLCTMIPYEVVVRRAAHGSFLKRYPHLKKGHNFSNLIVEFFLKTSNQKWEQFNLPCDDPFIQFIDNKANLFEPDKALVTSIPFLILENYPLKDKQELLEHIAQLARQTFLVLEKAWQKLGKKLVDFKVEFGIDSKGNVLLADVIDNDSWRLLENNMYLDKQVYRDGGNINTVAELYKRVAHLSNQFEVPKQRIIIWRASEKDDIEPLINELKNYTGALELTTVTYSLHKEPAKAYYTLQNLVDEIPNSVLIALVGRSNGAGPTLAANTTIPVITVPMGWQNFPEDVWSSLRVPSLVPLLTVLDVQNAALAALQILALQSPHLYALLRLKQEKRLLNIIPF